MLSKVWQRTTALQRGLCPNWTRRIYIVGPSGAGKSTYSTFIPWVKHDKGSLKVMILIWIKSKTRYSLCCDAMGVVFKDYKLLPKKTVYKILPHMQVIGEAVCNIKKRVKLWILSDWNTRFAHSHMNCPGGATRLRLLLSIVNNRKSWLRMSQRGTWTQWTWEIIESFGAD